MNSPGVGCRDALAIILDDRRAHPAATRRRALDHVDACPACASVRDDPTAGSRVLASLAAHRPRTSRLLLGALLVAACLQLALAVPWLVGTALIPGQGVATSHVTRDGALGLVVATLGLLVAWRPRYALAATLLGVVVVLTQAVTGVIDSQDRTVSTGYELTHLLAFAILLMIALIAGSSRRATPDATRAPPPLHSL